MVLFWWLCSNVIFSDVLVRIKVFNVVFIVVCIGFVFGVSLIW